MLIYLYKRTRLLSTLNTGPLHTKLEITLIIDLTCQVVFQKFKMLEISCCLVSLIQAVLGTEHRFPVQHSVTSLCWAVVVKRPRVELYECDQQINLHLQMIQKNYERVACIHQTSIADPDLYAFGPPGSGAVPRRYGSGSRSFYHQAKKVKKKLDSYCFVTSLWLFIFEKLCNYNFKK